MRTVRVILAAALATPLLFNGPASALPATPSDAGQPVTVVVTLADDLGGVPAADRPQQAESTQNALLDDLPGDFPTDVTHLTTGNVVVATVSPAQRTALAADPRVAAVGADVAIAPPATGADLDQEAGAALSAATSGTDPAAAATVASAPPVDAPAAACTGTQAQPQLEPEALGVMNVRSDDPTAATAAALGYDGRGVTIGIITTNLDPASPNFVRTDGTPVITDYRVYAAGGPSAPGGAGEAFGDVSSIGAQGTVTYDLADIVDPAAVTLPDGHCWIRVVGVAPAADLVVGNVQDQGTLTVAGILQAIDYSVTVAGVDILSESLGLPIVPDTGLRSAVQRVNTAAVEAGVTVVVSSGDAGANNTISVPAALPGVISVGATTTTRLYAQVGAFGISRFGNGTWRNGAPAFFSSSGTTPSARTIDLVAPGFGGWSSCSTAPQFQECDAVGDNDQPADLFPFAGTSESAPFVAGIAALVIQAYRDGHAGAAPTPDQVRRVLTGTATDLGLPADVQGNGQVDARAAVLAARSLPADDLEPTDDGVTSDESLVADVDRITASRTSELPVEVTVTNTGSAPVTLDGLDLTEDTVASRSTFPVSFDADAEPFLDGLTSPQADHEPLIASTRSVEIPADLPWARLQLVTDPVDGQLVRFVELTAIAPDGTTVNAGYSTSGIQLTLPRPDAGTWTVVVQALQTKPFTGVLAVDLGARTSVATVTAAAPVLAPGASTQVRTVVPTPIGPGDRVTTLRIADRLSVPVVLRVPADLTRQDAVGLSTPLLPTAGRQGVAQQTVTWDVDVPAGRRSLTAVASLPGDNAAASVLVLIDPNGHPVSVSTLDDDPTAGTGSDGVQSTVPDPAAGRWRVHLQVFATLFPVAAVDVPVRVDLTLDAVAPTATGLPAGITVPQGADLPVTLTVTNPGGSALTVVGDARGTDQADVALAAVAGDGPVTLPTTVDQQQPLYVVPPFSTALTATAEASVPTAFGVFDGTGRSEFAPVDGPLTVTAAAPVLAGPWHALFAVPGPVADTAPAGTATVAAVVRTARYDTTVTDPTGAAWMTATGRAGTGTALAPGATGTLTAVLHADTPVGSVVQGFLAVEAAVPAAVGNAGFLTPLSRTGDVLAVFPYSFVVGEPAPTPTPTTEPTPPPSTESTPTPTWSDPGPSTSTSAVVVPTSVTPSTTAPVRHAEGPLAFTGSDARTPALWGLGLLLAGAGVVVAARRRRSDGDHG